MIVTLADRAVLAVTGVEARPFLQGLLTQDVMALAPDRPLYAGLLSPQGKALFAMILHDAGQEDGGAGVLIDVAATRAEALAKRLAMYRLRKAVTIAPAPLAVLAAWDGDAASRPADPRAAELGARWLGAAGDAPDGSAAWGAHRLAVGVPGDDDIGSDELLWLEADGDLLNGVSFAKGCYVGQENTARMHHRDKVRRRLLPVALAGDPGEERAVVDAAGRSVGTLRSHAGGLGVAHLRVEAVAGPLICGGAPLTVRKPAWVEPALVEAIVG